MNHKDIIYNYWDYGILGMLILFIFPTIPSVLHNLNLSIWWIVFLCFVSEVNHRRQDIKKAETYYMLDTTSKKTRGINERVGQWVISMSWDVRAYLIFTTAVITFFGWLVVFA